MVLSDNVSLSRDWREQLSEGRQFISKRHDSLQPFSAKSLPGAGMSLLWEGGLCAGRHFSVRCNFLGPSQTEALWGSAGGVWLRGFKLLLVPLHCARESGVREHQLQHLFSFLWSSREDEDGPQEPRCLGDKRSSQWHSRSQWSSEGIFQGPRPLNRKIQQAIEGKLWVKMNGDKSSTLIQGYAVLLRSDRGQSRTPVAPQTRCPRGAAA